MPDVGETAPDFNALDQNRERFFLSKAVKSGKILLVFYPGDNTPVCTSQLSDYRDHYEAFKKLGIKIYGITLTTYDSQKEFHDQLKLPFPLLNDYDYRISQKYKILSFIGHPNRALFLIDENQKILYKHVELLPLFRRTSEELIGKIKELLPASSSPAPKPVNSEASPSAG